MNKIEEFNLGCFFSIITAGLDDNLKERLIKILDESTYETEEEICSFCAGFTSGVISYLEEQLNSLK